MNQNDHTDLHAPLTAWRSALEAVWTRETAYPFTKEDSFRQSSSAGQCAVTSILLLNRLPTLSQRNPRIALGEVRYIDSGEPAIPYHGWLEIGDTIIDLTADQATRCDERVIISRNPSEFNLKYLRRKYLDHRDARQKEVWDRYISLSRQMARIEPHLGSIPGIHTGLDLIHINDSDVLRYLFSCAIESEDPERTRLLNCAIMCAQRYSFASTRTYPRPDHPDSNKRRSPAFTLAAIVISLRTTIEVEQRVVEGLLARYPDDDSLLNASERDLATIIGPAGMANRKAHVILGALRAIWKEFRFDWSYMQGMPLHDARAWLLNVDGIGPKAADCFLTVGLGRPSIAVDINVFRVASRIFDMPWAESPDFSDRKQVSFVKNKLNQLIGEDSFLAQIIHTLFLLHGKYQCRSNCNMAKSAIQSYCKYCEKKYLEDPWQKALF